MNRNEKAPVAAGAHLNSSLGNDTALPKVYRNSPSAANNYTSKVGIHEFAARCEAVTGKQVIVKNGRIRALCAAHGGKDPNMVVWTDHSGEIRTKCYSHGCDRKDIIEALGFTLADILPGRTPTEAKQRKIIRNRIQIESELINELLLLYKILSKRNSDRTNKHCQGFREENPGWAPVPEEPWEREIKAAKRIIAGLGVLYGR